MASRLADILNRQASRMNIVVCVALLIVMSFVAAFGFWGGSNIIHEATLSEDAFSKIIPQTIALATMSYSKFGPTLRFTTSSQCTFERGQYTPKFELLREAVHDKERIMVSLGNEVWFPAFLRALMPKSELPIYQVVADGKIILSFEEMKEFYRRQLGVAALLLFLGVFGLLFACFSAYALVLWLR